MIPLPTRRLAALAAIASLAMLVLPDSLPKLLLVNGVLLVVAVVDAFLGPGPDVIEVTREMPGIIALDGTGEVTWTVRNPSNKLVRVAIADDFAPSLRASSRRISGPLPAGRTMRATATLDPSRRGRFDIDDLVVRVEGPLGLGARQRTRVLPATLRVHPAFRSRNEAALRIERARILDIGLRSAKGRGGGTDFDQLREYTPDDEFRRIDWAATARSTKPIVRTYRAERNQNIVVLLDNGRVMAGRVGGVPRVEFAMDAALLIATVATRLGDKVGLVAFDREVRAVVPPSHHSSQASRVSEAMYDLEPQLAESDYRGAFAYAMSRFRRRSMFIILTDLVEQAIGESLLPALPLIARSHLVVVGAVRDPEVVAWSTQSPPGPTEAHRRAAALRSFDERARATARLRALGATVVDVPGHDLAPAVGDAYLAAKATGKL
ncbi:MAG TPA: DUF58 domain-containing protein [Acidimicrobiales bacterium]|nr:DUF58 domain-containing protein [Acidimicrobiales bacterium]